MGSSNLHLSQYSPDKFLRFDGLGFVARTGECGGIDTNHHQRYGCRARCSAIATSMLSCVRRPSLRAWSKASSNSSASRRASISSSKRCNTERLSSGKRSISACNRGRRSAGAISAWVLITQSCHSPAVIANRERTWPAPPHRIDLFCKRALRRRGRLEACDTASQRLAPRALAPAPRSAGVPACRTAGFQPASALGAARSSLRDERSFCQSH